MLEKAEAPELGLLLLDLLVRQTETLSYLAQWDALLHEIYELAVLLREPPVL